MSVIVNWQGKIGYGDIISPICYVHNEADRQGQDVQLNFYFGHTLGTKFKVDDAETINDRVDYIVENTTGLATVHQYYNQTLGYMHSNYNSNNLSLHNLRFANQSWTGNNNHIAVVSSITNKKQFTEYAPGKAWKDPLSNSWQQYVRKLQEHNTVVLIDYTTPIEEAVNIINTSKLVVGYHGSLMWLARWLSAPMLIISSKPEFSQKSFPWCIHSKRELYFDPDELQDLSLRKLYKVNDRLNEYLHRV